MSDHTHKLNFDLWLDSQAISVTLPVFPWQQECWHSDRGCVPGAGYSSQTGDLAVCLPAADVWGAGTLPEQDLTISRIQSARCVHTFVFLNTFGPWSLFLGLCVHEWKGVCVWDGRCHCGSLISSLVQINSGAAALHKPLPLPLHCQYVCVFQFHHHHHLLPLLRSLRLPLSPIDVAAPWGWQGPRTGAVWGDVALMTWSLAHTWAWVQNFIIFIIISSNSNATTTMTPLTLITTITTVIFSIHIILIVTINTILSNPS